MIVYPNIKINIGLSITGKRPDGFHNIESVFVPVNWTEVLEVVPRGSTTEKPEVATGFAEQGKARFFSYGIEIPGEAADNLCLRVFKALEGWYDLPPTDIHLLKSTPIGAGLGGGSADAALCLRALVEFYDLRISDVEAMKLLEGIGSDCPFFWKNSPQFVYGKGEKMRPLELDLSAYYILLVYPNLGISTKEAYAGIVPKAPAIDLELAVSLPVDQWKDMLQNDFEKSLFPVYPELAGIKKELYDMGALYAQMSGSGSTLYGIFKDKPTVPDHWSEFPTWVGKL